MRQFSLSAASAGNPTDKPMNTSAKQKQVALIFLIVPKSKPPSLHSDNVLAEDI
jgi:hypothetical protein